jgi:hypothetical protein
MVPAGERSLAGVLKVHRALTAAVKSGAGRDRATPPDAGD